MMVEERFRPERDTLKVAEWRIAMEPIIITPTVGIGPFMLGMSEAEVREIFERRPEFYNIGSSLNYHSTIEQLSVKVDFDADNKVNFIEIGNPYEAEPDFVCLCKGIDVFRTMAEELVKEIDKETKYVRDHDAEAGYSYRFSEIQLLFWRERVITEEILNSEEFQRELSPENQEIEKQHFFFTTVAVTSPGY
ncbi:hypothetical protein [Paenibacillus arenilitoris]|uniref:Uncharacterized protein n=1 Tax=Paenibacillus arenilitoris TaxID=2772299 RepID=A0A927H978_9BACL|nr:hypothetical protein [Paenibacillus arenilitoris]MBD2871339.1 hypothetical protein [Paenibacillus arenilitoris]